MSNKKNKSKVSKKLSTPQIFDKNINTFTSNLMRLDTDEVLRKAGIGRHKLSTLLYDDEIDQAIDRRKQSLSSNSYTLNPSEGVVAKFVYEQLDKHLDTICNASIDSKLYGYDVAEMLWDVDSNIKTVKSIMSKPIQWLEPKNDGRLLYHSNNHNNAVDLMIQSDFDFRYLYQINEPSFNQAKGKALLSRVYWLWYFKTNGWKFWSKYLERFGSPLLVGLTDDDTDKMAEALLSAHQSGVLAGGIDSKVTAITSNGNGEAFATYDEAINKRIVKYLLGQTLTSGADKGGTYGQGKVHQEQQEIIFSSDRKYSVKAIQHFINVICYANGYTPPLFEWVSKKGLQIERAERDKTLYEQGVRFTSDYYADMYDLDDKYIEVIDTDVKPVFNPVSKTAFAKYAKGNSLSTKPRFTAEQQLLEDLADNYLATVKQPIDKKSIIDAVSNSKNAIELEQALYEIVGNELNNEHIEQALYVSDVLGYVDAHKQ